MEYIYCPICANKLGSLYSDESGIKKCTSDKCNFVFFDNPIPVVTGIVNYRNQIVLIQNQGWNQNKFSLVTGFVDKGETPENAIVREVKEELDLDAKITHFIGHYNYSKSNQLIIAFAVNATGNISLGEELANYKAVDPKNANCEHLGFLEQVLIDWKKQLP